MIERSLGKGLQPNTSENGKRMKIGRERGEKEGGGEGRERLSVCFSSIHSLSFIFT